MKTKKKPTKARRQSALALANCSACPECGSVKVEAAIPGHPEIIECSKCGHPREATTDEIKARLRKLGYNPDKLVRNIVRYVKTLKLDRPNNKMTHANRMEDGA